MVEENYNYRINKDIQGVLINLAILILLYYREKKKINSDDHI